MRVMPIFLVKFFYPQYLLNQILETSGDNDSSYQMVWVTTNINSKEKLPSLGLQPQNVSMPIGTLSPQAQVQNSCAIVPLDLMYKMWETWGLPIMTVLKHWRFECTHNYPHSLQKWNVWGPQFWEVFLISSSCKKATIIILMFAWYEDI
jgi:hypothetical protein